MATTPRDARFLLALSTPLAPLAGYWLGANWHSFLVFFLAIPLLDRAIGRSEAASAPEERARLAGSPLFRAILLAYVPLQLALILWGARIGRASCRERV